MSAAALRARCPEELLKRVADGQFVPLHWFDKGISEAYAAHDCKMTAAAKEIRLPPGESQWHDAIAKANQATDRLPMYPVAFLSEERLMNAYWYGFLPAASVGNWARFMDLALFGLQLQALLQEAGTVAADYAERWRRQAMQEQGSQYRLASFDGSAASQAFSFAVAARLEADRYRPAPPARPASDKAGPCRAWQQGKECYAIDPETKMCRFAHIGPKGGKAQAGTGDEPQAKKRKVEVKPRSTATAAPGGSEPEKTDQ